MDASKLVVKCGNFAVLVDLHILPIGSLDNASWFTPEHRKEVSSLIRDPLEQRVRQFEEARRQKMQAKPKKDLTTNSSLCFEGENIRLTLHFMKRHVNLRCVSMRRYRELRVFPERVVVTAIPQENAAHPSGNLNLNVTDSGQSRSKYFSTDLVSSSSETRTILQKMQAKVQPHGADLPLMQTSSPDKACDSMPSARLTPSEIQSVEDIKCKAESDNNTSAHLQADQIIPTTEPSSDAPAGNKRRHRDPSSSGEDTACQTAKRPCFKEAAPSRPSALVEVTGTGIGCGAERLTQIPRDSSVKPVSSGSSISSRSAAKEAKKGSEPRTSRLRRLKKP